jgi:protein-serine/threonine kinase
MTDLLPPSPSAVSYPNRTFVPAPSALSSSVTVPDVAQPTASSGPGAVVVQASPPPSSEFHAAGGPSPSRPLSYNSSHSRNPSLSLNVSSTSSPSQGPLRPLDFSNVMLSRDGTHAELARTIDDLRQWLSVVETDLIGLVDKACDDRIEEEQEDFTREGHHSEFFDSTEVSGDVPSTHALQTPTLAVKP